MKQWLWQLVIIGGVLGLTFFFLQGQIPCKQTLTYRIGSLDPRFGLSQSVVEDMLRQAEVPWETLAGRELFTLDQAHGAIVVNFIFDERQERTQEEKKLNQAEAETSHTQEQIGATYDGLSAEFDRRSPVYEKRVKMYEVSLEKYNKEVERFNRTGTATEDDVTRLQSEAKSLDQEAQSIETERLALNQLATRINALSGKEQQVVNGYNQKLQDFQERFRDNGLFDQGDYGGKELNIYQFRDQDDLRLVLMHELGHSLGLSHVESSHSIMYYLMQDQDSKHPKLSKEDQEAFESICAHPRGLSLGNIQEVGSFLKTRALELISLYENSPTSAS